MNKLLTKSDFILYRDCPHNVWVKWHKPEEYNKFEISDFEKSLGLMGNDVEELARQKFPGGFLVEGRGENSQKLTKDLISKQTPVIFQAVFATDKFLAAADVLKWNGEVKAYDIYEVKMSSADEEEENETEDGKPRKVNRKKEEQFEYDLSFQVNVARLCGVDINNKYLIRLNRDYTKVGRLNLEKLFEVTDKTEIINDTFQAVTLAEMESAHLYLSNDKMPSDHCRCYYEKGRKTHCTTFSIINPDVPEYSVHDLNRIGNSKKLLGELISEGLINMDDISEYDDRLKTKTVSKDGEEVRHKKQNQVKAHKTKEPIIDYDAIKKELDSLTFPLYFLDYETYPTAIPMFDGYRPYQHIVFQFSLHILRSKDSELEHKECLILDDDPAERLVESLRNDIGDTGTIISWYKTFENSRNKELAKLVPKYADFLNNVISRTYDLMDIIEKQYYVHHGFRGRSSIKQIQTVIAPDFSYKKLAIKSGADAIEAYRQMNEDNLSETKKEEKKKDMLKYCQYDTEIMYIIWKYFNDLIK